MGLIIGLVNGFPALLFMKWIIYLFSFTDPPQTIIVYIYNDSIMYYRDSYEKKRITYKNLEKQVFMFDGGFLHVGWKYVNIEFTNGRRKYKIKRISKTPDL